MTEPIIVELESQALAWPERARSLVVRDGVSSGVAGEMLRSIKTLRREIAMSCDPVIAAAFKAHRTATEQKRTLEAPLVEAESILKLSLGAYIGEEQRRAREEAARAAAEQKRIDDERRLAEAADLEAAGEIEAAERLISEPTVSLPPPSVQPDTPRLAGVSTREVWKFEVVDLPLLVQAVAAGKASVGLLQANEKGIGSMVRGLKGATAIPGVRVWAETGVSATVRR